MKVCFLFPENVRDYYGRSALSLLHEKTSLDSVVEQCDDTVDVVFSACVSRRATIRKLKDKYPRAIFVNYLWDLPFWEAQNISTKRKSIFVRSMSRKQCYVEYLRLADLPLSASTTTRWEVLKNYQINTQVLQLFFPSIDITPEYRQAGKIRRIISVGRLAPYKRFDVLISAVSLMDESERMPVLIIGEGSEKERLKSLAEESGVSLSLPGWVDRSETLSLVGESTVTVFPSVMEGNPGWGPCESTWLGVPAIMADIPETREYFGDDGLYFLPDDPQSLAKELAALINDSSLRSEVVNQCQRRITFYTVEEGLKRFEDFIHSLEPRL